MHLYLHCAPQAQAPVSPALQASVVCSVSSLSLSQRAHLLLQALLITSEVLSSVQDEEGSARLGASAVGLAPLSVCLTGL